MIIHHVLPSLDIHNARSKEGCVSLSLFAWMHRADCGKPEARLVNVG